MNHYPQITYSDNNELIVRADLVFPERYIPTSGEYVLADSAVAGLYLNAKKGDEIAEELLMELCGNYMNKLAFNALYQLGKMANINTRSSRQGFAQYLFEAYRDSDIEKLKIIAFWAYPQFVYKEYDKYNKCIYSTTNEGEFTDHLYSEMTKCHLAGVKIRMRIRMVEDSFVLDVLLGEMLSTFYFCFSETTFNGIVRVYSDITE